MGNVRLYVWYKRVPERKEKEDPCWQQFSLLFWARLSRVISAFANWLSEQVGPNVMWLIDTHTWYRCIAVRLSINKMVFFIITNNHHWINT